MRERLPAPAARLIGRDRELAELRTLMREGARLITLTGAGGSGKTALALAFAQGVADDFASSAFVDLSGLRDPSFVPQAIATALIVAPAGETPFEAVVGHIGAERTLLLLDNFEQLLPESAVVADLLSACPALVVIATSRAPLELRWERVYQVGPLALPAGQGSLGQLRETASVALFVERARAIKPLFSLDAANAAHVRAIVERLEGLPLAIELAAARLRLLSVAEIADRVHRALDLLAQDDADRPLRQRTMRATIDWSIALLSDTQQRLLRRLAVFEGGAMLDAVQAVCAEPDDSGALLDDLEDLVQAGVVVTSEVNGETHVRLPATVRERATELLHASGEQDAAAERHLRFMKRLCVGLSQDDVDEEISNRRMEIERENVRAALRYAFGPRMTDREPGVQIVYAMLNTWYAQGAVDEAIRWTDLALAMGRETQEWSLICCEGAMVARLAGDLERAERMFRTALDIHAAQQRPDRGFFQSEGLAQIATDRADEATARAHYERARAMLQEAGQSDASRAAAEFRYADHLYAFGRTAEARTHLEDATRMARDMNAKQPLAASLALRADIARLAGDRSSARQMLDEAWRLAEAMGHRLWQRNVLASQIRLAAAEGDAVRAAELARRSLGVARNAGDRTVRTAAWIDALAYAALTCGQHPAAARLFALADGFRAAIGAQLPPVERSAREHALATLRAVLGARMPDAPASSSLAPVFTLAEETFAVSQGPAVTLSRREREVGALVARGLSNRAIAERLILGERTVETHVERLLRKLDVRSRHEVAARAEELSLPL